MTPEETFVLRLRTFTDQLTLILDDMGSEALAKCDRLPEREADLREGVAIGIGLAGQVLGVGLRVMATANLDPYTLAMVSGILPALSDRGNGLSTDAMLDGMAAFMTTGEMPS